MKVSSDSSFPSLGAYEGVGRAVGNKLKMKEVAAEAAKVYDKLSPAAKKDLVREHVASARATSTLRITPASKVKDVTHTMARVGREVSPALSPFFCAFLMCVNSLRGSLAAPTPCLSSSLFAPPTRTSSSPKSTPLVTSPHVSFQ